MLLLPFRIADKFRMAPFPALPAIVANARRRMADASVKQIWSKIPTCHLVVWFWLVNVKKHATYVVAVTE